ncbi:MAG: DUF3467 domain-containing protein [Halioglobus sp.]
MTDKAETNGAVDTEVDSAAEVKQPQVRWNDSNMSTSYANVVNVSSTREEVTLFFGTNQTWNVPETKEIEVLLSERMILNPHAAKRLWALLGGVLTQYEKRYGQIKLDLGQKKPE